MEAPTGTPRPGRTGRWSLPGVATSSTMPPGARGMALAQTSTTGPMAASTSPIARCPFSGAGRRWELPLWFSTSLRYHLYMSLPHRRGGGRLLGDHAIDDVPKLCYYFGLPGMLQVFFM